METITTVRKANRIIRVTGNELDRYLANGYEVVKPKAVQKVVPPTVEEKVSVESTIDTTEIKPQANKRRNRNK